MTICEDYDYDNEHGIRPLADKVKKPKRTKKPKVVIDVSTKTFKEAKKIIDDTNKKLTNSQLEDIKIGMPTVFVNIEDSKNLVELVGSNVLNLQDPNTLNNIINGLPKFGKVTNEVMQSLDDEILSKTAMDDSGDLGDGIKQILVLAEGFDRTELSDPNGFKLTRYLKNLFSKTKTDIVSKFNTVASEIDTITKELESKLHRIDEDSKWIIKSYEASKDHYYDLENAIKDIDILTTALQNEIERSQKEDPDSVYFFQLSELNMSLDIISKRRDTLLRSLQIAEHQIYKLRGMQLVNINSKTNFEDLIQTTIPIWKSQMSNELISQMQKKDIELSNYIAEQTNDRFKNSATMTKENMISIAKANNRPVIDNETIKHMQSEMVSAVKQVLEVQKDAMKKRQSFALEFKNGPQLHEKTELQQLTNMVR